MEGKGEFYTCSCTHPGRSMYGLRESSKPHLCVMYSTYILVLPELRVSQTNILLSLKDSTNPLLENKLKSSKPKSHDVARFSLPNSIIYFDVRLTDLCIFKSVRWNYCARTNG